MFWKKILFLAAWYLAGNVVASVYSSKKKRTKKRKWKEDVKALFENFLETQKNFISDVEKKYLSEETQEKFSEKKKDFLKHAKKYTQQGKKILEELQQNKQVIEGKKKAKGLVSTLNEKWRKAVATAEEKLKKHKDEF